MKRKHMGRTVLLAAVSVVMIILIACAAVRIYAESRFYTALTVEAGTEVSASDFVKNADSGAYFTGESGEFSTSVPGEYDLVVKSGLFTHACTLYVEDTIAPTGETVPVSLPDGETCEASEFVARISDATHVEVQFALEPDFTLPGEQTVLISLTDLGGNVTILEETLTIEPIQEESVESELVEQEDTETGDDAATGTSAELMGEESTESKELDLSSVTSVLYHEGGGHISDFISGISYSSVLNWLSLHREDDYYLGTPYPSESDGTLIGGSSGSTDRRNPNGDCETSYGNDDYAGEAMLNCTGFVWHVFYKASGMTAEEAFAAIPCWGGVGARDWISYLRNSGMEYKTYYGSADSLETIIAAMIEDGYMEPGDLIWTWGEGSVIASDGLPSSATDPHVGIYTGTYFGGEADEWWHSLGYSTATDTFYGENLYDSITPMAPCVAMTVIKLGSSQEAAESE